MVTNVTGLTTHGVRDWLVQRGTALLILAYVSYLAYFVVMSYPVTHFEVKQLFSTTTMRVVSTLVAFSITWHAWIGVWTIFTDYVKCSSLRLALQGTVIVLLFAYLVWAIKIFWSV